MTVMVTELELAAALREVGWGDGVPRLAHVSLSAFGHVVGGEQSFFQAMMRAADGAAIIMPSQSWQLCDPAFLGWTERGTLEHETASKHRPAYSPRLTPSRSMGRVVEVLRTAPGAIRSEHPHRSFSGIGFDAARLLAIHDLDSPVGERSPLAALYDARSRISLLGVDASSCTALHLAELRAAGDDVDRVHNSTVAEDGTVVSWTEPIVASHDFVTVVEDYRLSGGEWREVGIGATTIVDVPMVDLVDHATAVFARRRPRANQRG